MIANRDASVYVDKRVTFKGSNIFSEWKNDKYIVYSYGKHFPMYIYKGGVWYANGQKYSASTSRHQSHCMPSEPCKIVNLSAMHGLIDYNIIPKAY